MTIGAQAHDGEPTRANHHTGASEETTANGGAGGSTSHAGSPRSSQTTVILEFFERAAAAGQTAMTAREVAACWPRYSDHPRPANLSTRLSDLLNQGRLHERGGGGQRIYVLPGHTDVMAMAAVEREAIAAYTALEAALAAARDRAAADGVPAPDGVPLLAVRRALAADAPTGLRTIAPTLVRVLTRLADRPEARPPGTGAVRYTRAKAPDGHVVYLWALGDEPAVARPVDHRAHKAGAVTPTTTAGDASELAPAAGAGAASTFRQAVIATVEGARSAMGCPPTRYDWRLFVEAAGGSSEIMRLVAPRATYAGLRVAVGYLDRNSARGRRGLADRGLGRVETPYTVAGGPAARYALTDVRPVIQAEMDVCRALDVFELALPADEMDSVAQTTAWVARVRASHGVNGEQFARAVGLLIAARRAALVGALLEAVPVERWPAALEGVRRVIEVRSAWFDAIARSGVRECRPGREITAMVTRPARSCEAVETMLDIGVLETTSLRNARAWPPVANQPSVPYAPFRIGDVARADAREVLIMCGGDRSSNHPVVRSSRCLPERRRTPGAAAVGEVPANAHTPASDGAKGGEGAGEDGAGSPGGLGALRRDTADRDRVDGWAASFRSLRAPRAQSMIANAVGLVGHVLRDANVVRRATECLPLSARPTRRALMVAAGLLGDPAAVAELTQRLAGATDADDATAALLAAVLAAPDEVVAAVGGAVRSLPNGLGRDAALAALAASQRRDVRLIVV